MEARFRKLKPNLRESSIRTYAANVRRLQKVDKHLDYGPISTYLKQLPVSIAVNLLTALIVLEGRTRFGGLYDDLSRDAEKIRGNQRFTPSELKNWTSSLEVKKGIKRIKFEVEKLKLLLEPRPLKSNEFQILQHLVVLSFYHEFHFRSDLVTIRLGHHKGQNMYKNDTIYLNQFKTDKHFARRGLLPLKFTPSRGLKALLRKFIYIRSLQKEIDHDYLICNRSWKPFKRGTFYKYISGITWRYIGKRFGTTMMRHIYISEFLNTNPSLEARKRFMYGMQQLQLETQEAYRRFKQ